MDTLPSNSVMRGTRVEISVKCSNLKDADVFSKSDPMCVLFAKQFAAADFVELGRTETIMNNLNPEFTHKFTVDYFFEERQMLRFAIYDIDSTSRNLADHDFLGSMECSLGEIVANRKLARALTGPGINRGSVMIAAEELSSCKDEVTFELSGVKLDKKDFFGKSDPFLAFYRVDEDGQYSIVHRTEVIKKTLNPKWKPFTISARTLCNGDPLRTIKIKCIDWNRDGSEDLIGECQTSLQDMQSASNVRQSGQPILKWPLMYTSKKNNKTRSGGTLLLHLCRTVKLNSFVDFVNAGTQLNCTIAIDFTYSNGVPELAESLHAHHPPQAPSQYARALAAVGEIIQDYDSDKLFPVLGFGARLPPNWEVSHNFFVNGSPSNPYCEGIGGVLAAYSSCVHSVKFYGPTNFAPIINHVASIAAQKRDGSEYFILLILTDGIITDMGNTKTAIVSASALPLSIIIVGIGSCDFEEMNVLDGDNVRLTDDFGRSAQRDIVQFVPFRNFMQTSDSVMMAQARLAKEVLAEIPDQFLSYMRANNIKPGSWSNASRYAPPPMSCSTAESTVNGWSMKFNEPPPAYTPM